MALLSIPISTATLVMLRPYSRFFSILPLVKSSSSHIGCIVFIVSSSHIGRELVVNDFNIDSRLSCYYNHTTRKDKEKNVLVPDICIRIACLLNWAFILQTSFYNFIAACFKIAPSLKFCTPDSLDSNAELKYSVEEVVFLKKVYDKKTSYANRIPTECRSRTIP